MLKMEAVLHAWPDGAGSRKTRKNPKPQKRKKQKHKRGRVGSYTLSDCKEASQGLVTDFMPDVGEEDLREEVRKFTRHGDSFVTEKGKKVLKVGRERSKSVQPSRHLGKKSGKGGPFSEPVMEGWCAAQFREQGITGPSPRDPITRRNTW